MSERPKKTNTENTPQLDTIACDCSSPGDGASCDAKPESSGRNWVKTAVAGVVLVAAVAAAGYSIIRNNSAPAESSDQIEAAVAGVTAASTCAPSLFSLGGDSTISPIAVAVLTGVVSDVEVAFVFLSGSDNNAAQSAMSEVESVIENLLAQGKKVKAVSFAPGSPGYVGLAKLGKVESFPSVAALGSKGGYTFLSPGEISEVKLLRAFVVATTPVPGCVPGAPGCAPTGGN